MRRVTKNSTYFSDFGYVLVFHVVLIHWIQSPTNAQIVKIFLEDTREGFNLLILACLLEQEIFDYPMKKTKLEEDKKYFALLLF